MTALKGSLSATPIRWKIVGMMLGIAVLSLALAGIGLLLHTRAAFEREIEQRLTLLADVIGLNSVAALTFEDEVAASETLAALGSNTHIVAGGLYDTSGKRAGRLFARYLRDAADGAKWLPQTAPAADGWHIGDGYATRVRTIMLKGRALGKVILVADTDEWRGALVNFLSVAAILFVVVLAIGFFVSISLQRLITQPITDLLVLMRRIGAERDYSLRAVKLSDDELGSLVEGFNAMLAEIAKSRAEIEQAQKALRQLNEDLEQRVRNRTQQLQAANTELEAFSYSVSHDLRAPLRAIDGFSRVLLDDHAQALNESGRDSLFRVRRAAQRMGMLIDDLLKLARVTRTEPARETVNLSALAQEVAEGLQQSAARPVNFILAPKLLTQGDAQLLRILLENLLGNAWKFSSGRTQPCVELGVNTENGIPVYFVRDNGAGFDMAYANKLFSPFQRLHTAAEFPGTGIGLATVHRIVQKHHGRIWTESAPDRGATFYFTLVPATPLNFNMNP